MTGYPWSVGQELFAADLNSAFSNAYAQAGTAQTTATTAQSTATAAGMTAATAQTTANTASTNASAAVAASGQNDPTNALGLGASAIIRGVIYLNQIAGIVPGTGTTLLQQQSNYTLIQLAFTVAVAHGWQIFDPGQRYEFSNVNGLLIPASGLSASGLVFRGSRSGTFFVQYYASGTGAPILTIGDVTSAAVDSLGLDIEGMTLLYGAAQTGLTSSIGLRIGNCSWGRIASINVGQITVNPAYRAMTFAGNNGPSAVFSMTFSDIGLYGAQADMLYMALYGTGNVWIDLYMNNGGTLTYTPLTGSYINWQSGINNEMTFIQCNCEWGATNCVINAQDMFGLQFIALHIEGVKMTGFDPSIILSAVGNLSIHTLDLIDLLVQSGNLTGTPTLILDYATAPSAYNIENFNWINNHTGQINTPMFAYTSSVSLPADDVTIVTISNGVLQDQTATNIFAGNWVFDSHMPAASFPSPERWERYSYGALGSSVVKAVIPVSSAKTIYGQWVNPTINVPASITSFNLTIAATQGATGTQATATSNWYNVRRLSGTAAGTLTVKDDAGTTIGTNTTSATNLSFLFNGTHAVTFTPVT